MSPQQVSSGARSRWWRAGWACLAAIVCVIVVSACDVGGGSPEEVSNKLAAEQSLSFPVLDDVGVLDPALANNQAAINIVRNVFNGLYAHDPDGNVVPDLATAMPKVSDNGRLYTVELRSGVRFSNGDPVTASDVAYSWRRAINVQGPSSPFFSAVVGYATAAKGGPLSGVKAVGPRTIEIRLQHSSGPFAQALGDPAVSVVDQTVIEQRGRSWWASAQGLVGTGPFKMSAYRPGEAMDFVPVSNWWGGSPGKLTRVHVDVFADQTAAFLKYRSGGEQLIGGDLHVDPTVSQVLTMRRRSETESQVHTYPTPNAGFVGFNFIRGPFAGAAGAQGRLAFTKAIDREQLASVVCRDITCTAATGGLVPPGVQGFLGANSDPTARFDPEGAKRLYRQWDPTGEKVEGLALYGYTLPVVRAVAENLQAQWEENLGVRVKLNILNLSSFIGAAFNKQYPLFVLAQLNPNYPSYYYETFACANAGPGGINPTGWCDKEYSSLITRANGMPLQQGLPLYAQAADILYEAVPQFSTYYTKTVMFIQPYVRGAGRGKAYMNGWKDIRIMEH